MKSEMSENKKARFDYNIEESFEAGIVLTGEEIKAVRARKANLAGSYGRLFWLEGKPEAWLVGANIMVLKGDPQRSRKLLFHRREIDQLIGKVQEKGFTLIPLKLYLKRGFAKVEMGLGKGKKMYDKREKIKKREIQRKISQSVFRRH